MDIKDFLLPIFVFAFANALRDLYILFELKKKNDISILASIFLINFIFSPFYFLIKAAELDLIKYHYLTLTFSAIAAPVLVTFFDFYGYLKRRK